VVGVVVLVGDGEDHGCEVGGFLVLSCGVGEMVSGV
jgi:hypothetical protein